MNENSQDQDDYEKIPEGLREIYEAIEHELIWVHGSWKMFKQLYGKNELRIELMNESAPSLFAHLQRIWFDSIILEICRIADRETSLGKENLVVAQLLKKLDSAEYPTLASNLQAMKSKINKACDKLRQLRNRKVAHSDLDTALGTTDEPIPGISRAMIEEALLSLRVFVNEFRMFFLDSEMGFEAFHLGDDGEALIQSLKRASVYRDLERTNRVDTSRMNSGKWTDA